MITTYTYEKPNVNLEQLIGEINGSSITIALKEVEQESNLVKVVFKGPLSEEEKGNLDQIVSNHVALPHTNTATEVIVKEDQSMPFDTYTGKLVTKNEPYNGPLYVTCVRFKTGVNQLLNGADPNWFIELDSENSRTIIDYRPTFSYQIDACGFKLLQNKPAGEVIIEKVCIAPGTQFEHTFVMNWEISKDQESYERITSPKYVKYYPSHPLLPADIAQKLNNIRLIVKHAEEEEVKIQFWLSIYIV